MKAKKRAIRSPGLCDWPPQAREARLRYSETRPKREGETAERLRQSGRQAAEFITSSAAIQILGASYRHEQRYTAG